MLELGGSVVMILKAYNVWTSECAGEETPSWKLSLNTSFSFSFCFLSFFVSYFAFLPVAFFSSSAIYIELYYVYAAVWGHYAYTLYGILFLVFVILVIVTACITIALTYFQLSMEDHEWWWRSFISGG
jgi:hypothetical protein